MVQFPRPWGLPALLYFELNALGKIGRRGGGSGFHGGFVGGGGSGAAAGSDMGGAPRGRQGHNGNNLM